MSAPSAAMSASMPLAPTRGGSRTILENFCRRFLNCPAARGRRRIANDIVEVVSLPVERAVGDGIATTLRRQRISRRPGDGQREVARAAVKLQDAIRFIEDRGADELVHHLPVRFAVDLSEYVGVEFECEVVLERNGDRWIAPSFAPIIAMDDDTVDVVGAVDEFRAEPFVTAAQAVLCCDRYHGLARLIAADDFDLFDGGPSSSIHGRNGSITALRDAPRSSNYRSRQLDATRRRKSPTASPRDLQANAPPIMRLVGEAMIGRKSKPEVCRCGSARRRTLCSLALSCAS